MPGWIFGCLSQWYTVRASCWHRVPNRPRRATAPCPKSKADPAKGGATLQALRGECPEDLQEDIFEKGWAHTIYMRIQEFQRVSLKTIVEAQRDTAAALSPLPRPFPRHP